MPLYTYKAVDGAGKNVLGRAEAVNVFDLEQRLARIGSRGGHEDVRRTEGLRRLSRAAPQRGPVGEINRMFSESKLLLAYLLCWLFLLIQVVILERPFTVIIDTFLLPILIAMVILRRVYHLEPYFRDIHFDYMGRLLLVFSLLWLYFTTAEYLTAFYGSAPAEMRAFWSKLSGPFAVPFWAMVALSGYLVLNATITYFTLHAEQQDVHPPHWIKPIILLSIPWAISIHTVTGFLYAGLPGRLGWRTAIMAPRFLASALAAGPALPWTVDVAALTAAEKKVREHAGLLPGDNGAGRALLAEIATITRSLVGIVPNREPTSAG